MGFFSTYKLYKQGTSQVVAWLGKTASLCGYVMSSGDTSKQEKKSAKKSVSKSNGDSSGESQGQVTRVKVRELPALAKAISESLQQRLPDFKTLPDILKILKDVIDKRKQWGESFRIPDASTLASNKRHKHFVTVLEDVFQILGGVPGALQPDKEEEVLQISLEAAGDGKSTSMEAAALSNLFAVLDIEEPADQADIPKPRPASTSSPSPSGPATVTYELEEDDEMDMEEVYFMIYCFFEDFQAIRKLIDQNWKDYKLGQLDLNAAALTTNIALEMLQRAESTLLASIPKKYRLTCYEEIAGLLVKTIAVTRGVDPNFLHRRDDVINMDLQDIADFICSPVYIIVSSFLPVVVGRDVPVMKGGFFGKIDLSGRPFSWRERFTQDKIVLCEFLPEFCLLKQMKIPVPAVDELSCGLMEMMGTKVIPLWLVLGCQIYLDIHHTMLSRIGMALDELKTTGLHVSKTLQHYADFSKGMTMETWSEHHDQGLRTIKLEADLWVNRDMLYAFRKKLFNRFTPPAATTQPYSLLSRHPLLCGLMNLRLNLRLHEAGVILVGAWGSLPAVIHLYNALKQESALEDGEGFPLWQDLESVIEIQGKERIFVGEFPTNAEEYLKSFCLSMGYSASLFAKNRRVRGHPPKPVDLASKRGPREMIATSSIEDILRGQYGGNETVRSEVTFSMLENEFSTSSSSSNNNRRPRSFTSVSFLSTLKAYMKADVLALNLDYIALHVRCFELLRAIETKLDAEFCKRIGPGYLERESQLPFIVGYLFMIATGRPLLVPKPLKVVGEEEGGVMKSVDVLTTAGELVKELVQKEGDREVERVRSVCGGYDWFGDLPDLEPIWFGDLPDLAPTWLYDLPDLAPI